MILNVDITVKQLRETLCVAMYHTTAAGRTDLIETFDALIAECDRQRPIGPDGKHGDRHTATCGCEDVWYERYKMILNTMPSNRQSLEYAWWLLNKLQLDKECRESRIKNGEVITPNSPV